MNIYVRTYFKINERKQEKNLLKKIRTKNKYKTYYFLSIKK